MKDFILNHLNLFIWAKDKNLRYTYCNENYARSAELDSPHSIVGKYDHQMPWAQQADFFNRGDDGVLKGKIRLNVSEVVIGKAVREILVTESKLFNAQGECIGLVGSYIDITGQRLEKKAGYFNPVEKRYYLGGDFGDAYLTAREIEVLKKVLLGYTAKDIGEVLKLSPKTVESHIDNIKLKLQASTKGDLIATAIQFGLTQIIELKFCST